MLLLITFAFLAGVVTVLSPCILPILPLILSSSLGGEDTGRARPLGVIVGFVASFTLFTLFLSTLVNVLDISADALRLFAVVVIGVFGVSLLVPQFQMFMEKMFSRLTGLAPHSTERKGFSSGLLVGFSLGLLWTPCVGPILASVISLALTGSVTLTAFFITLAYAFGTAIPMLLIMWGGRELLNRVPWLLRNTGNIQKGFGVLMILVAFAIYTNADRTFQTYIVNTFPQYGVGLTQFEDQDFIQRELNKLRGEEKEGTETKPGKLMSDLLPKGPKAPELISGGIWINSEPLSLEVLKGKVVIVDFWTYSCINCQRTLPYLKQWHQKYADKGLVIIGVHAPEFEFEKSEKNLRKAVGDFGLTYPIMQDNDFATWRAYQNHYWPAKYFIDKDGVVRYTHFGEGAYDESERVIQQLLEEAGAESVSQAIENPTYQNYARTPEIYLGYERIKNFASPERITRNQAALYTAPTRLPRNGVAYSGEWSVMGEYAHPKKGAVLEMDFEAKEVFLVMRPMLGEAQIKVLIDGKEQSLGEDVVQEGKVVVDSDRLYKLILLENPGHHLLKLEFLDDNAELYAFTFG
jgi:cytochrome c biogenesis protein CcdA/thiol-disulfide isomerase/thioredoxin